MKKYGVYAKRKDYRLSDFHLVPHNEIVLKDGFVQVWVNSEETEFSADENGEVLTEGPRSRETTESHGFGTELNVIAKVASDSVKKAWKKASEASDIISAEIWSRNGQIPNRLFMAEGTAASFRVACLEIEGSK